MAVPLLGSMGKGVTKAGELAGQKIQVAIDKVVETRFDEAIDAVAKLSADRPDASPTELANEIIGRIRKELTIVGAGVGGAGAVPGVGTAAVLASTGVELGAVFIRLSDMVLRIGVAYGHDQAEVEERRLWVLTSLIGVAAMQRIAAKAGAEVSKGVGGKLVGKVSGQQLRQINKVLGRTILTKYGTKRGAIALGRAVPFGLGAVIGGGSNNLLVTATGKHAKQFFDETAWTMRR